MFRTLFVVAAVVSVHQAGALLNGAALKPPMGWQNWNGFGKQSQAFSPHDPLIIWSKRCRQSLLSRRCCFFSLFNQAILTYIRTTRTVVPL